MSWQAVTNLELVILISLLAWSGSRAVGQPPRVVRTRLASPILCLLAWMVVSSLLASAHRANSLQFTARYLTGVLIFFMVVQTITHRRRLVALMVAVTLVACVVAALGVLESFEVAWVLDFLQAFRPGTGFVKNQVRATSTLQYPTITSMYLELAFGLTIGLLLCQVRRWQRSALFLSSTLIAAGTIVTLTRAGLILLLILPLLAAGFWLIRKGADDRFRLLLGISGMVVVLLGLSLLRNPLFWLRLTGIDSSPGYQVEYDAPGELELAPGSDNLVRVRVKNPGLAPWRSEGENAFALSYHWLDRKGEQTLVFEGVRTPLGQTVEPTESLQAQARILAPPHPGEYILAWDLVQEHRLWFSTAGAPLAHSLVKIYAAEGSAERRVEPPLIPLGPAPTPRLDLARPTLWRGALRMLLDRPLLGVGPDNFRLLYGNYLDLKGWRRDLHANNMYLEFFATTGLVGGGLFLWFVWRVTSILGAQWRKMGDAELSLFLGISAATAAFLIHGLFDHFLAFTPTYVMIWVVVGLVASLPNCLTESVDPE